MHKVVENIEQLIFYSKKYGNNVQILSSLCSLSLGAVYWREALNISSDKTNIAVDFIFNCGDNIGAVRMAKHLEFLKILYLGDKDISYLANDNFIILSKEGISD